MSAETNGRDSRLVLVTVGTTHFDALIKAVDDPSFVEVLQEKGYTGLAVQHGTGPPPQRLTPTHQFSVECFPLRTNFERELQRASLVISHAGAGSVRETLRYPRPLVVVVNDTLMDNHQVELADAMEQRGYAFRATVTTLVETIRTLDVTQQIPLPRPRLQEFASLIDREMGFRVSS